MQSISRYSAKAAEALFIAALVFSAASEATTAIDSTPLFLTVSVPPNIVVTLDDSGSMRRAYVPEICGTGNDCAALDEAFYKSSFANPMAYNPKIKYPQPKNAAGAFITTTFNASWRNGFDQAAGTAVNLSRDYIPSAYLDLGSGATINDLGAGAAGATNQDYMGHYASDFRCSSGARQCQYSTDHGATTGNWFTPSSGAKSCNIAGLNATQRDDYCRGSEAGGNVPQGMPAYYYNYSGTGTGCSGTAAAKKINSLCYQLVIVSNTSGPGVDLDGNALPVDERQNFANWYSFARTRNLATSTATSLSFADLDQTVRVAWQSLNSCHGAGTALVDANCDGWKGNLGYSNAIKPFTTTNKANFFSWVAQLPTHGTTPLPAAMERAGEYFKTSGNNSPYDNDLTTAASAEHACRRKALRRSDRRRVPG